MILRWEKFSVLSLWILRVITSIRLRRRRGILLLDPVNLEAEMGVV